MDQTNLYSACKNGDLKKLKRSCDSLKNDKKSGDFLLKPDPNGFLPLDLTVINDKFDCCQYLLENFNLSPLTYNQAGQSPFFYAIDLARLAFLKYFIESSKKYLPARTHEDLLTLIDVNKENKCLFQLAIESSHPLIENILQLMLNYIKFTFPLKKKFFIGAVRTRNTFLVEYVLNQELKEEERRELLNLNFNLNSDFMRKTNLLSEAEITPLIFAINRKDRQLISFLITEPLIDVNMPNSPLNDQTPLFASITLNDLETVLLLFEKKVNNMLPVKGLLPLKHALTIRKEFVKNSDDKKAAKQNFMIIELLCTTSNDVHMMDDDATCSFDLAVTNEYTDVIGHFIGCHGDLYERKNKIGRAPIDYAKFEYRKVLEQKFPRKIQ